MLRIMTLGFENGQLQPPTIINEVDFIDGAKVLEAYERVSKGAKGKFVLSMKKSY